MFFLVLVVAAIFICFPANTRFAYWQESVFLIYLLFLFLTFVGLIDNLVYIGASGENGRLERLQTLRGLETHLHALFSDEYDRSLFPFVTIL